MSVVAAITTATKHGIVSLRLLKSRLAIIQWTTKGTHNTYIRSKHERTLRCMFAAISAPIYNRVRNASVASCVGDNRTESATRQLSPTQLAAFVCIVYARAHLYMYAYVYMSLYALVCNLLLNFVSMVRSPGVCGLCCWH